MTISNKTDITNKKWCQLFKSLIIRVVVPGLDINSVVGLQNEILGHVIHDDHGPEVAPDLTEVLDKFVVVDRQVLPVKPVLDQTSGVDVVDDEVGVVLARRGEDDELVVPRELLDELVAVGPDLEVLELDPLI